MGLHAESTRSNLWANFMPDQRTVHEAQGVMRLGIEDKMRIKVRRIRAPDAQDTTALGLPHFRPPQCRGGMQQPSRQRHASGDTSLQQLTTTYPLSLLGTCWRCIHRSPLQSSVTVT